ncbi:hypothetical protein Tco_1412184, partial [Tanacetum coccineum]
MADSCKSMTIFVDDKGKGHLNLLFNLWLMYLVFAILVDDKSKVTGIKILDDLEQRIEKVEKILNKAKEKMLLKKGKRENGDGK